MQEIKNAINLTEKMEEQKKKIEKKTLTVKELAQAIGVSQNKARQLTHAKDFPVLVVGRQRLTVRSKLDEWLESSIGQQICLGI